MAGIDHTRIFYHNGEVIEEPEELIINGKKIIYGRDGDIYKIDDKELEHIILWDGYHYEDHRTFSTPFSLLNKLLYKLNLKERIEDSWILYYKDNNLEVYSYYESCCNISYIFTEADCYVIFGGYGHYQNPYTHFYHRGYGEEFENKMTKECYEWICERQLKNVLEYCYGYFDNEDKIKLYHKKLRFKSYWDMTDEERKVYLDNH
jgi:hypothetical protein